MVIDAEDVDALIAEFKALRQKLANTETIVVDLQLRVRELEQRPAGLRWLGIWDPERVYQRDEAVTDGGSVWACTESHRGRKPGQHPTHWRLAVKRGRDGRDAREFLTKA
jgi:hypothetical protein